jgi:hypothetical protein
MRERCRVSGRILALLSVLVGASSGLAPDDGEIRIKPEQEGSRSASSAGDSVVDWARIPPWRQTSFFGIRAKGRVFAYVVDCSGSMESERRLLRAKSEIRRSILDMRFPQRFLVVFFNEESWVGPGGSGALSADHESKQRALNWLRSIHADGGTDPRDAMRIALAQRPDAVFFLTDGELPQEAPDAIAQANPGQIPIHCVDLSGGAGETALRQVARQSGGTYAAR